ncbi:hypothetical protein ACFWNN_19385 [Lentzea sp. NPDC058450]|uniref:hypothetical protein n=1 Tax=Lentzea sp. NPDC058450 TaxID=3346505 RepID=UPI003663F8D3
MKNLRDVPSPDSQAYDRARAALHESMTGPATVVRPKRWFTWPRFGGAVVGAAAVATAIVMGSAGGGVPSGGDPVAAPAPAPAPKTVESPLVKLASQVKAAAAGAPTGDASLVVTTKTAPDGSPYVIYTVYSDRGDYVHGDSVQGLADSARKGQNQATEYDANVLAAARLAATGDLEKARFSMITAAGNGYGLGLSDAEADKIWKENYEKTSAELGKIGKTMPPAKPRPTGKELEVRLNNTLWHNSTYALFMGAANAEVREGVLKLLATLQDVSIAKTAVDGQPAMTLTAGKALLPSSDGSHVVTVNADNGLPIRNEFVPTPGSAEKGSAASYKSSRINYNDLLAGKI